jgi:PAS domain S-box-containing protein
MSMPHAALPLYAPQRHVWLIPLLCSLLGLCLLGGAVSYTVLNWQRRVTLESERGTAIAALSEAHVSEMLRSTLAGLQLLADRTVRIDDWAAMAMRAARAGGRIGSASLVAPDGVVLASTEERNVDLLLTPQEFGGGWRTARFGVGGLFLGRDLYDRRPVQSGAAGNFMPLSVTRPQGSGFVVGTISIRSLNASLTKLLDSAAGIGVGVYWRDGSQIHVVGRSPAPVVLPAPVVAELRLTDAWRDPPPTTLLFGGVQLACRSSPDNPFILCTQWTIAPLAEEWVGGPGVGLVALVALVALMVTAGLHFTRAEYRREQERQAFRIRLAHGEKRQAAAIEASGCIVWEYDVAAERVRYFGFPAALLGFGTPMEESQDQALSHFLPEDAEVLLLASQKVTAGVEPSLSVVVRRATGSRPWLRFTARRDPAEPDTIVGTIVDVTSVVEASERYRSIFREVAQPILLLDEAGCIEEVNPATEAVFGAASGALIGRAFGALVQTGATEDGGSPQVEAPVTLASLQGDSPRPLVGCRMDGTQFPLAVATGAWMVGGTHKVAAIVRDLSAEKEIERRLIAARSASDNAARVKTEFLSTMSHEIRTPLNGVIGMAGLLTETDLDPTQAHYVTVLQDSADHLLELINDILDISKLESTKLELEPGPFDVAGLVQSAIDMVSARAREKGLALGVTIAGNAAKRVIGDVGRIRQVLLNLLGNAVKFTDHGVVQVVVAAAPAGPGSVGLHFIVRDSGVGIPPERLGRLFLDFSQLDGSIARRYGGTGLGLAISQRLIERMGGEITVESQPGMGSTFSFTLQLPQDRSDSQDGADDVGMFGADVRSGSQPATTMEPPEEGPRLRILLAEDNPTNQLIARRMLESMGHRVHLACNGQEAVEAVRDHQFDVVLMDVMMPEMDGIAASRMIRTEQTGWRVPILAVTANAFEHDRVACLDAGMDGFLGKPFNRASLSTALARITRATAETTAPLNATVADGTPEPHAMTGDRAMTDAR